MRYEGPKKIVILGGGIADLAAADALTAALEPLYASGAEAAPEDLEIVILEGETSLGGRAVTWEIPSLYDEEHPDRPARGWTPHGIHFLWHSYRHTLAWTEEAKHCFTPADPSSTYCAWLAPPDLVGGWHAPPKIVALHVCDPSRPETAWNPHARAPRGFPARRRLGKRP